MEAESVSVLQGFTEGTMANKMRRCMWEAQKRCYGKTVGTQT